MASHASVDLTKQCNIRAINFNEADLITYFANDYGHENWMKEAIKKYYDKGDLVILISSSGNSKNDLVAGNYCKLKKIDLVTFTGFNGNNKLFKLGRINFSLNSKNYNQIDNVNLTQSSVSLNINTADIAYYLRGYKAIDKEIDLIENRDYKRFKFIEEELNFFKAQNIKFADYYVYLMYYNSL